MGSWLALAPPASAADCSKTSFPGETPITDLGTGTFQGREGGLYPNGSNVRPPAHDAAGVSLAQSIVPLDGSGDPDPTGKYVLLSIGMSIAMQEFDTFASLGNSDAAKDPHLTIVNAASPGHDAHDLASLSNQFWADTNQLLASAGLTPNQVAVVWIEEVDGHVSPSTSFSAYTAELKQDLASIVKNVHTEYPNAQLAYFSGRAYGGYASTDLNPEPFAYYSSWAVKSLIQAQIDGSDPSLAIGQVPWLAWGSYNWANGVIPRLDGLTWSCGDFRTDNGQHFSDHGAAKAARMLLNYFVGDDTGVEWLHADGPAPRIGATIAVMDAGFQPQSTSVKQGQAVRWNFGSSGPDTATDATAVGLFDSVVGQPGSSFAFTFFAAGTYPYRSTSNPAKTGVIKVAPKVSPSSGSSSTEFAITWSSVPAPSGYVFDVAVKQPGATTFATWKSSETTPSGTFSSADPLWVGSGKYMFRARLRKVGGKAGQWSPAKPISVS
jgi:plastocyanin